MKKVINSISFILVFLLLMFSVVACSSNNPNVDSPEKEEHAGFEYPDKSAFAFNVSTETMKVKKGEKANIFCSLENQTNQELHIEHGIECITYSYNGESEVLDSLAILDTFDVNEEIERNIEIIADKSGTIIVQADFRIRASKYSDDFEE